MGLPSQVAVALLREHRHKPISGQYLTIGRQTVYLTAEQALALVERELGFRPNVRAENLEIDNSTRGGANGPFITDRAFLSLFSNATYRALDVTAYEGADVVADLSGDLPKELIGSFDFLYDGSCLDNIFDPAAAMRNIARLLSRGGRTMLINQSTRVHHAYIAFSMAWFHDFFALNDFADAQVYLAQWDGGVVESRWDLYRYQPLLLKDGGPVYFGQDQYFLWSRQGMILVIAEKGDQSAANRTPVQYQYRPTTPWKTAGAGSECGSLDGDLVESDPYARSALRFARSRRPMLLSESEKIILAPEHSDYAETVSYVGSLSPIL